MTRKYRNPYSVEFAIPQREDSETSVRQRRQDECPHEHHFVQCSSCLKIIGSEVTYSEIPHDHPEEVML